MITTYSCGTGHGPVPDDVELAFPLERRFRDPHLDPELRELTGESPRVQLNVLNQPGAYDYLNTTVDLVANFVAGTGRDLTVAFTCVGGRHRSVVFANALKTALASSLPPEILGEVRVMHRDIGAPILNRRSS